MLIGIFFSEVGTKLLKKFCPKDPGIQEIRSALLVSNNWSDEDFKTVDAKLKAHSYHLDSHEFSLEELHSFLSDHKVFLLALLENPQLFEHDRFTDLLHAVFILQRNWFPVTGLSTSGRLLQSLVRGSDTGIQPVRDRMAPHMHYQKKKYPYLFSLAMRTNRLMNMPLLLGSDRIGRDTDLLAYFKSGNPLSCL